MERVIGRRSSFGTRNGGRSNWEFECRQEELTQDRIGLGWVLVVRMDMIYRAGLEMDLG